MCELAVIRDRIRWLSILNISTKRARLKAFRDIVWTDILDCLSSALGIGYLLTSLPLIRGRADSRVGLSSVNSIYRYLRWPRLLLREEVTPFWRCANIEELK